MVRRGKNTLPFSTAAVTQAAMAKVELLIRAPAPQVYRAFVEPELLTQFWLATASEPLTLHGQARWEFLVPGAAAALEVRELIENERIAIEWDDETRVEWTFEARDGGQTLVRVLQFGFPGSSEEALASALDATQGFTLVLCELKAWLEQGAQLNAVRDKARLIEEGRKSPS
jgi:uncharacterized protein YndB with AHSA1/START domain